MKRKEIGYLLFVLIELGLVFASYNIGAATQTSSDFTVFWQAGINYGDGASLYHQVGGACRYIYPPFAAMLFRLFALFNLKTAAAIYCFINFQLWFGIFYFTRGILSLCNIPKKHITISLWAGFILSFRYFLYHLHFIQMNELMLLMSLAGVKALLKKKNILAMGLLVTATFIKIIPVLLLVWALTKSKWKTYLWAASFIIICLALPMVIRGFGNGVQDIKEYYQTFLDPFINGKIETRTENQGLNSALYKVFTVTDEGVKYGYFIKAVPLQILGIISKLMLVTILVLYGIILFYSRFIKKSISVLEISLVLLITLLVCGITWEYHFVSFGFVFTVLFAQFLNATKQQKYIFYPILLLAFINNIIGSSTVGMAWYYKSCGYSFLTLLALIIAMFQAWCFFSKTRNYPVLASIN